MSTSSTGVTGGTAPPPPPPAMPVPLVSSSPPPLDRIDDLSYGDDISLPYDEDFPRLSPETEEIRTELPTITVKEPLNEFSDTSQNCKIETNCELNVKDDRGSPNRFTIMEDSNVEDLDLKYDDADEVVIESPNSKEDYDLEFEDFTTFTAAPIVTRTNLLTVDKADDFPNSDTTSDIKTQETSSSDNISFTNEIDGEWETDLKLSDFKSENVSDTVESPPNFETDFPKTEAEDKWPIVNEEYLVKSETVVDVNDNKMKIINEDLKVTNLESVNCDTSENELKANLEDEDEFDDFTFHKPECGNLEPENSENDLNLSKPDLNISESQESSPQHAASEPDDLETDDFVFQKSESSVLESQKSSPFNPEESKLSSFDDFDDFASFQTTEASIPQSLFASDFQPFDRKPDEDEGDDDFGDFATADENNFTPAPTSCDKQSDSDMKILLSQKESDILELISKAVEDMFIEEVEDGGESLTNLQMKLGSAWKALSVEHTIFQWNESASQKKLLAALGIDSRNILFGSKWNPNMPRFAANLGANPLQPVKQSPEISRDEELPPPSSTTSVETIASESFADQQPSSYAESLLLDLENLMSTLDQMTSGHPHHFKISDLFTNASNDRVNSEEFKSPTIVARKINLPDTHIFTPENCETPWSHTIHYDAHTYCNAALSNEASVPAESNPDKEIAFDKPFEEDAVSTEVSAVPEPSDLDDFGEFHSSEVVQPVKPENILLPSKITESVAIQPTTINWPNPGNIDSLMFDEFATVEVPSEAQWFDSSKSVKNEVVNPNTLFSEVPNPLFSKVTKPNSLTNEIPKSNSLYNEVSKQNSLVNEIPKSNSLYNDIPNSSSVYNDIPKPNPIQFVLKETKIVSDLEKPKEVEDDFSEFKSVSNSNLDDFDDFQSAPFQSSSKNNNFPFANSTILQPISNKTKPSGSYQILQPLSLESFSQINWPDPGVALPEMSNFNPVNSIQTYSEAKEKQKSTYNPAEDDWSDFMSIKPSNSPKKEPKPNSNDEDDWTDFIGSAEQPSNRIELKTISQNIHNNIMSIPNLAYSNPRSGNNARTSSGKHVQNL